MGSGEKKQKKLFKQMNEQKQAAKSILLQNHLFKEENDLMISGLAITPANNGGTFSISDEINEFYNNNSSCFLFKLIDDSIITLYLVTNDEGELIRFSYAFCSCPFFQDLLIERNNDNYYEEPSEEIRKQLSESIDKKKTMLDIDLLNYFRCVCHQESDIIYSLVALSKNPIYLRCDYDSEKASEQHPEYHLTLNFISESRFKIDSSFTLVDFVVFILDSIYGIKESHPYQYIHLAQ